MTEYQPDFSEVSEDYKAFVDKFKPKKTTDDCYTPEPVFRVVLRHAGTAFRTSMVQALAPAARPARGQRKKPPGFRPSNAIR